uniref:Putative ovule protein n=1 Tax=Solanum chacoense TaxID=4108 RepID=A0A0V0HCH1_SOLCH
MSTESCWSILLCCSFLDKARRRKEFLQEFIAYLHILVLVHNSLWFCYGWGLVYRGPFFPLKKQLFHRSITCHRQFDTPPIMEMRHPDRSWVTTGC